VETRSSPRSLLIPLERVVLPDPLSPATATTKTLPDSLSLSGRLDVTKTSSEEKNETENRV
jgi:hypothetical protein